MLVSHSYPAASEDQGNNADMDVYQEAVGYLQAQQVDIVVDTEPDVLEEEVFHEEMDSGLLSPLNVEGLDFPDTPTPSSPEEMLDQRLVVLKGILESEEVYLRELEALLMPMKALRASAGTSQPVLSSQQVHTVFYQVPELRDLHKNFYSCLKGRLYAYQQAEPCHLQEPGRRRALRPRDEAEPIHRGFELVVGDLFLKMVNQIGLYGGFIENYEDAVGVVRKCTNSDPRFRTLAQSMMTNYGADKTRTQYTFEALLYKPLDRVTKTTLVLQDLLKTTPDNHTDHAALHEALRLSRSFLSGVNESSQSHREVTLSHGLRRQLIRDGFVVDASDGKRSLRHLFLYTDLLLCTRWKPANRGKQDQYRFCWYLPLAGLKLRWFMDEERSADTQLRLQTIRTKMHMLRRQLRQPLKSLRARSRKKLEQMETMLLMTSTAYTLDLQSPSGKSRSLVSSSLYELEEWREAIDKLTKDNVETVPPDLLTLTGACVKLRMTQQPLLHSADGGDDGEALCGTLTVAIHSARGLEQPACAYVCVEVDGFDFYETQAQTHSSILSFKPQWEQTVRPQFTDMNDLISCSKTKISKELCFQVDGTRNLRVLCISQSDGQDHTVLGKTTIMIDSQSLSGRWRRQTLNLGFMEVNVSLKFIPHPLDPPTSTYQQQMVFTVPIETVARQEGVLVPHVVRCCVEEVETRGMDEVGIYRISGTTGDINALKTAFNNNLREAVARLRSAEVNAVSGVLKLYFRELPEPLIPTSLFQSLARTLDIQDVNLRLVSLLSLLQSCPDANRHTFLYLLHHLRRVSEREDINKMSLLNLATVFGPSLLRPPVAGGGNDCPAVDISQEVVVQVHVVFSYLQCHNLPNAQICLQHDSDAEDETTHL